ncbi:MAG: hypothetical protein GY814_14005 [Gammaproteobacteria bacterium]|nr:hypothetical protein [Gammaproteobacteria bacterium]
MKSGVPHGHGAAGQNGGDGLYLNGADCFQVGLMEGPPELAPSEELFDGRWRTDGKVSSQ